MRASVAESCVRISWWCLACAVCAACTPAETGPLAGASDSWKNAVPSAAPAATPPATVWERYAEALSWPAANAAPFISRGHEPELRVDVRANDLARPSYTALVADTVFPDGSVLLEQAHAGANDGFAYAMLKAEGHWRFLQLDAHGGVLASGALPLCAGCHSQAPADQVFGLPRDP